MRSQRPIKQFQANPANPLLINRLQGITWEQGLKDHALLYIAVREVQSVR